MTESVRESLAANVADYSQRCQDIARERDEARAQLARVGGAP